MPSVARLIRGQLVEINGLQAPKATSERWRQDGDKGARDFNGQQGQLIEFSDETGEWTVATFSADMVSVPESNIRPLTTDDLADCDIALGPASDTGVMGAELTDSLSQKGYALCKLFVAPEDLTEMANTADRCVEGGAFSRLPPELETGYLGKEGKGKTLSVDLESTDTADFLRESPLKIFEDAIETVGTLLRPFVETELGFDIYSRSSTMMSLPFSEDEDLYSAPELENEEAASFLSMMWRAKVMILINSGPGASVLTLTPKAITDQDPVEPQLTIQPGMLCIFSMDRYKFACSSEGKALSLSAFFLDAPREYVIDNITGDLTFLTGSISGPSQPKVESVPVVSMGMRYAFGVDEPWKTWVAYAKAGWDTIVRHPTSRWDCDMYYDPDADQTSGKSYTCHGGFSDGIELFDCRFFDISPAEARGMDPTQRQVLEVSYISLQGAGWTKKSLQAKPANIGVFVGLDKNEWNSIPKDISGGFAASSGANAITANRFNYCMNLKGASMTIDTACSASLVCTHTAKLYLLHKHYDPCEVAERMRFAACLQTEKYASNPLARSWCRVCALDRDRLRQQLAAATSVPVAEDNVAVNRMLDHLWPYVAENTTRELTMQLEPSIRMALSKLPSPLNKCSVDLQRSTLGTRPLRFLAPHASWSSPTSFTISLRLEWDSDSSVYLMFTGATLGIVNLRVVGNLIVELLLSSGGSRSLRSLLSGFRVFFPTPPDIQFDVDRGQLATAVNFAMLKRMIFQAISEKWAEKMVFPNCQGLSWTSSLDILDVKRPSVEGILILQITSIKGLAEPGKYIIEMIFGSDVHSACCELDARSASLHHVCRLPVLVRACAHQRLLVKLSRDWAASYELLGFLSLRAADLVSAARDGARTYTLESTDPSIGAPASKQSINVSFDWWPVHSAQEEEAPPALLSVGIYSAMVPRVDGVFWVVLQLGSAGKTTRTSQKSPQNDAELQRKLQVLQKYRIEDSDLAEVLDEVGPEMLKQHAGTWGKVEWLESFDFRLDPRSAGMASLTVELWHKAPGKSETKTGVHQLVPGCGRRRSLAFEGSSARLQFRTQLAYFAKSSDVKSTLSSAPEEPEAGISMASAFASAVDGGMVVSDAVTTAVNEGLAAMEGEQTQAGKQTRQDVLTRYSFYHEDKVEKTSMHSHLGRCFTYNFSADGYTRGEATASTALKLKPFEREQGDFCLLAGSQVNQDGRSASLTAPNGPAQERCAQAVMKEIGVKPPEIDTTECHGTGTSLGDPIEIGAYRKVMASVPRHEPVVITSSKSNIGHCEGSAGISGFLKCVLLSLYGEATPNCHLNCLNPHLDMTGFPGIITTENVTFRAEASYNGVLSFGFGGTNACATVWGVNQMTSRGVGTNKDLYSLFIRKMQDAPPQEVTIVGDDWEDWEMGGPDKDARFNDIFEVELDPDGVVSYWKKDKEVPDMGCPYYITGTFNDWKYEEMEADASVPGLFYASIRITANVEEEFQILADKEPKMTFHPSTRTSMKSSTVRGPEETKRENCWCVRGSKGERYRVEFYRSDTGAATVSWLREQ
ncbi:ppsA [Symbiodinium microadriaticum]|nr:ppsA [Symbiodinium microadriaticum]